MDKIEIEATYESGSLRLPYELPLQAGQKVTITIHPSASTTRRRRGLIQWKESQEDLDQLILSVDNDPLEAS